MSSEKRLFLFLALTFASILGIQYLMDVTGLNPPPRKPQFPNVAQAGKEKEKQETAVPEKGAEKAAEPVANKGAEKSSDEAKPSPARPEVALLEPDELVLGSAVDHAPGGYRLEVRLEQKGAGVASVASSRYEAEFVEWQKQRHRPLEILRYDLLAPPSLAITLPRLDRPGAVDPVGDGSAKPDDEAAGAPSAAAAA